jgi:hypothetical protein
VSELNIFCRLPVEVRGETFNVVAGMRDDRPGEIIVQTNDDNDYLDERFPVRTVSAAAGIKFRADVDRYSWETLMIEISNDVSRGLNG